jgi:hypothetical protein
MTPTQCDDSGRYVFGMRLGARGDGESDLLLLLNGEAADAMFLLPDGSWQPVLDTGQRDGRPEAGRPIEARILLKARSLTLLERAPAPHP